MLQLSQMLAIAWQLKWKPMSLRAWLHSWKQAAVGKLLYSCENIGPNLRAWHQGWLRGSQLWKESHFSQARARAELYPCLQSKARLSSPRQESGPFRPAPRLKDPKNQQRSQERINDHDDGYTIHPDLVNVYQNIILYSLRNWTEEPLYWRNANDTELRSCS